MLQNRLCLKARRITIWLIVEGQGSLVHPGYSGVTLSLLHGSMPDAMIFCHQPSRQEVARYTVPLPSLPEMITQYEMLAAPIKPAKVIGLALNCFDLTEKKAQDAIATAEDETGLPATDVVPVRFRKTRCSNTKRAVNTCYVTCRFRAVTSHVSRQYPSASMT